MTTDPLLRPGAIRPRAVAPRIVAALTALGLAAAVHAAWTLPAPRLPVEAGALMIAFLALSPIIALVLTPRSFVAGWLIGLLTLLMGWRIAGLLGVTTVAWALVPAFAAYVAQFFDALLADRRKGAARAMSDPDWALAFLRIYVGFDLVPHFTEKLFAGPGPRMEDVTAFAGFGLPAPFAFVILGGLCELGGAIGIGTGFLTRLAGIGTALYFLIATLIGGHFGLGFIWASPGGGWEYPVLMMVFFLTFAVLGGGRFSLDATLAQAGRFPVRLRPLAFRRAP